MAQRRLVGRPAEGPEDLQGCTRGAPPEQQPFSEAELDHPYLPAAGVGEAEDDEGEIPDAFHVVPGSIYPLRIVEHPTVIGRLVVKL